MADLDGPPSGDQRAHRVGILLDAFVGLAGAADFLASVVDALWRTAEGREVVYIMRTAPPRWSLRGLASIARAVAKDVVKRRRPTLPARATEPSVVLEQMVRDGLRRLPLYSVGPSHEALARLCEREGIDVVLPTPKALIGYRLPWVGYIFDFQHRYYPHFFTARAVRYRDRQFDETLRYASTVIVNAHQVKVDAERFHQPSAQIVPLPFSAAPVEEWLETDPTETATRYGIGPRYFMISNQFWVHKRHEVAIAAFLRLAAQNDDIELVCTGATTDARAPDHFPMLQAMIARSDAKLRVHILGLIPKIDQIALLRGCLAVVQPTAFEGGPGGGSVFDAVALGVRSIVSDLPVNREIAEYVTEFFPLDDIDALAAAMERIADLPLPSTVPSATLIQQGDERRAAMGKALWNAADHAVADHAAHYLGNSGRDLRKAET